MIRRSEIRHLIPHAGKMCLLDEVMAFDEDSIECSTRTHYDPENPLRTADGLSGVCAIEYGAQAIALHGRLTKIHGPTDQRGGYIAAVRDVEMHVRWLHELLAPMEVTSKRISSNKDAAAYIFSLTVNELLLVRGRITLKFETQRER